uniref:Bifunctional purine biosynthesis protein PurH n=1 Tax=Streptomyces citricolor TaxID=212427 RepID=A0A7R6FHY1_9ACTN|nr:bifunctional purine biosynthesis protein PurH [Streptomyces citricolor]
MQPSINRSTTLAAVALILLLPLSAVSCAAAQKAVDCGSTAVKIAGDVADAGAAYNNADKDPQAAGKALQKLKQDLDQVGRNSSDTDLAKAVDDLRTQADKAQQAINDKQTPDLKPLGDAAAQLTKVCAK